MNPKIIAESFRIMLSTHDSEKIPIIEVLLHSDLFDFNESFIFFDMKTSLLNALCNMAPRLSSDSGTSVSKTIETCYYNTIEYLLKRGADINAQSSSISGGDFGYSNTALIYAAYYKNLPLIELLLKFNPDVNLSDHGPGSQEYAGSALYYVRIKWLSNAPETLKVIKLLKEHGAKEKY